MVKCVDDRVQHDRLLAVFGQHVDVAVRRIGIVGMGVARDAKFMGDFQVVEQRRNQDRVAVTIDAFSRIGQRSGGASDLFLAGLVLEVADIAVTEFPDVFAGRQAVFALEVLGQFLDLPVVLLHDLFDQGEGIANRGELLDHLGIALGLRKAQGQFGQWAELASGLCLHQVGVSFSVDASAMCCQSVLGRFLEDVGTALGACWGRFGVVFFISFGPAGTGTQNASGRLGGIWVKVLLVLRQLVNQGFRE